MSFNIGKIEPGGKKTFNLFICASHTLKGVKELVRWCRKMNVDEEYEKTRKYWLDFLKNARLIVTGDKNIDNLYKRSILVFKLMSDEPMHTAGEGMRHLLPAHWIPQGLPKQWTNSTSGLL